MLFHRLRPWMLKGILNLYGPYLGAGVRIRRIDPEWRTLDVDLSLHWYNRNAVGTHFGGSLYSMVDPHLMLLLMQRLGPDYIVWDKAASIQFLSPGKGTVTCSVGITDEAVERIKQATDDGAVHLPEFTLEVKDADSSVVASIHKQLYVRKKK